MSTNHFVNIQKNDLRRFIKEVFISQGLLEKHSQTAADVLCYADEHGFTTHGVTNLRNVYLERLMDRRINPKAEFSIAAESPGTAVIDAHHGLGLVAGDYAINVAIQKAKKVGVGCVVVRQSSHFGSAGYYTNLALKNGMIGIAMTNLGSQTIARPLGGSVNMIGTNPIAMSAPAKKVPPFVLDMSTTVVATGKIRDAQRRGESIPEGWLIDDYGQPQTDPNTYFEGTGHLQMLGGALATGGAKGYGLGLLVDILCGVLSGANVGPDPKILKAGQSDEQSKKDQNIGHFFLALNVEAFRPLLEFQDQMDSMLETLLNCPTTSDSNQVVYPGYLESMRKNQSELVAIDRSVFEDLSRLGNQFDITIPETEKVVTHS
ncbi:Ldh family oxidoreductase [Bacillus sp. WMMC1349]|uniref:Ldh family oxidoreductase n=1 Tax=Bacillus sp. WMMC1349 TaxID=2736254 RepID=UPI0015553409|nr:Ldh family oxidoreductase [Bacillus sp. WMMC1349]NPC91339.1 Ldh family oxidoreductase [Bacillus sp. WMMC1349]